MSLFSSIYFIVGAIAIFHSAPSLLRGWGDFSKIKIIVWRGGGGGDSGNRRNGHLQTVTGDQMITLRILVHKSFQIQVRSYRFISYKNTSASTQHVHKQTQIIHVYIPQYTNYIQINCEDMQLVNVSTNELGN